MPETKNNFDTPWKEILDAYFREFIAFFFPEIYADIDWSAGYEFLDKELQEIAPDAETGRRYADKLVKVQRKNGEEKWVMIHAEVQGQPQVNFGERMFIYNYRIRDRYNKKVVSIAILNDANANWRPQQYQDELWGCKVSFEFPIIKLLDYATRWEELEASDNPFATVVMAQLKTLETQDDDKERWHWKFWLTRRLYERGYSRNDIVNLYRFIDWLMQLPKKLDWEFKQHVMQYEEIKRMPYVTSIERLARQEGEEEGRKEGRKEGQKEGQKEGLQVAQRQLVRLLQHRFGEVAPQLVEKLQYFTLKQVEMLTDIALTIPSIQAFIDYIAQVPVEQSVAKEVAIPT